MCIGFSTAVILFRVSDNTQVSFFSCKVSVFYSAIELFVCFELVFVVIDVLITFGIAFDFVIVSVFDLVSD